MSEAPSLSELQRWMLRVISHPGSIADAAREPRATELIPNAEALVRGPGPLDAIGGVAIYHRMYKLRLREALEIDYPALQWAVGADRFRAMSDAYIAAYPSSSWTLNRLGDHWPTHLAKTEDPWLAELARLELAQTIAIQSPEGAILGPAALAGVPPEAFETAVLIKAPSVQRFVAEHDVVALYTQYREGALFAPPPKAVTRIVVYRREGSEQLTLGVRPFVFLEGLLDGQGLGRAIESAYPDPDEAAAAELQASLADWVGRGLFSAIRL